MKILLALLLALLSPAQVAASAVAMTEPQKIEALIASMEKLPGAVFIRNGTEYSAGQAAGHLRMKWEKAGKRVRTAEDFIRYCGSVSSMSGKKYQIRFADGRTVYSEDFFRQQLRRIEAVQAPATDARS